jgi:iron complex outermembrane recepter protein
MIDYLLAHVQGDCRAVDPSSRGKLMKQFSRAVLLCSAASLALSFAPGAFAQSSDVEDEIIVVGSRTAERSALESPVPVDVIGADDLAATGSFGGELGAALQATVPSFNFSRQSNSGPADIVRSAQLRGMSPDQVLVLVNGRRRNPTSVVNLESKIGRGTTPVDFNSIPLSAISRVEVLRDGAGAQYGSDAIAGVVNVILDDSTGGKASISYGTHYTDFEPTNDTITDGRTISVEGSYGIALGEAGVVRFGFDYRDREETNRAGFDQIPFFENQSPENLAFQGRRNYRPGDPAVQDLNLWVNGFYGLSNGAELYGFATVNDRQGEGAAFFRYPDSSANFIALNPNGYRPVTTGDNRDYAVTGGVRGGETLTYDASLSYGRNEYTFGVNNSLNPSLGPSTPRGFRLADYENSLLVGNLDFTYPVNVFGGEQTLAFGTEIRRETFDSGAGEPDSYRAGPDTTRSIGAQAGPGLRPEDAVSLDRSVYAAYAEIGIDVTDSFFVDAALRYEGSDDFDGGVAGKLAARYAFNDVFAVRGAVSNSFRAPSLAQQGFKFAVTTFGGGGALTRVSTLGVNDPIARALGAKPLDQEEALNTSLGFTVAQGPFKLSVDAFQINVDGRITLSERISCTTPNVSAATAALCTTAGITDANFFTNAIDTKTQGVDVVGTWSTDIFAGTLSLTGAYNYSETEIDGINTGNVPGGAGAVFGVEEQNTIESAAPKHTLVFTGEWAGDRWSVLGRATRHGETTRVFSFFPEAADPYEAKWSLDTEASFKATDAVTLTIGAQNVLDEYPELTNDFYNYFGNFPYDVLSPIGQNGRYLYAKVGVQF